MSATERSGMWVKICGITRVEDARAAVDAGADAIGVNFVETSARVCDPTTARRIVEAAGPAVTVYGVFADAPRDRIGRIVAETAVTGLQFHGGEGDDALDGWEVPVIRAVPARSREAVAAALERARGHRVLVDAPAGGGSGTRFDDRVVGGLDLSAAIVAGGLTPGNVRSVVVRLQPWGVDVAGGVETAPGRKDPGLIREFVANARST